MTGGLLRKLYGNAVVAAHLGQRRIPFLPRERIEALRDRRIRRTVAYAARRVPYYRELFAREGIDPREIRGAADLDRLPVLERDVVRAASQRFVAETAAARDGLAFPTSGSTGSPLWVHHDRRSLLANLAFGEREREPQIRGCGGTFRPKELYVGNETSVIKQVSAFYEENTLLPVRPRRRFVSVREPIEKVAPLLRSERPDILVGYGGWIDLFFKTVGALGLDLPMPKLVLYMAEALPHGAREYIEGHFGVPVMSRYSAAEAFKIGYYCEERTGFHLHEDLCHVRVVDRAGRTLPVGETGEIVLSNLVNRGSVFLNYRIGDVGALSARRCPCGRTFRLLSELEGRVEDILPLADGRFVHPRAVWQVFKDDRRVLQYQLVQHEPRRFALELATADEASYRLALARGLPDLQRLLGADAVIESTRRRELARQGDGKFRAVASRCTRRPPAAPPQPA
jgi:phenylacetate-CoA ligase